MRQRILIIATLVAVLAWAESTSANDKLVAALTTLGKAVDKMTANISNAKTDADAELLARVTRQALDNGLKQDRPTITIEASSGYCRVTIETREWRLWSEANDGKVVDHGATIH